MGSYETDQVGSQRCLRQIISTDKKDHFDNFTKRALTLMEILFLTLNWNYNFYFGMQTYCNAKNIF